MGGFNRNRVVPLACDPTDRDCMESNITTLSRQVEPPRESLLYLITLEPKQSLG